MRFLPPAAMSLALALASAAPADDANGLAARYPGDEGIASDPAVVLHENFEDAAKVFDGKRWPSVSNKGGALKLTREPANVHLGKQALRVTATLGSNTGGHLFRRLKPGHERLHLRYCVKFAADCDYIHHFVHMVAQLPPTPWPTGGAGKRPDGAKKFSVAVEPWGRWGKYERLGAWHFYNYWHDMPRSGDGKYWGASPDGKSYTVPPRGRWLCVEFMAGCNTPGQPDGKAAFWIDGKRMAYHDDINWRTSEKLKINAIWLMLYVTKHSAKTNRVNTVWFDDVVAATTYIGPPVPAGR